jgi:hypothetical protein
MRNRIAAVSFFALSLAISLILPGCGGGSSSPTNVNTLALSPTSASVDLNGQVEFTTCINNACGSSTTVTSISTTLTYEVNGVAGGSPSTGTIAPSPTDALVGIYTAPATISTVNQFNITVVSPVNPAEPTDTQTVTSNTVVVTITPGLGLTVSPTGLDIPAGSQQQFTAFLNNLPDHNATWSVSAVNGGNPGTIDPNSGVYTAPPSPPTGASIVVTATDSTVAGTAATATATATIVYADLSFSGPYAFSYTGNGPSGFQAVVGSLSSDGNGNITNFVEDILNSSGDTTTSCTTSPCGTYVVGADGRGTITLNTSSQGTNTLRFGLTSNQHAVVIRFDSGNTGSGTIDQQNLSDLGGSILAINPGPYVFRVFGADKNFRPEGIAGAFSASGGTIPETNSIVDLNDDGTVTTEDTTLQGSYSFDSTFPGTGRGILNLSSTAIGSLQFAFYIVDTTHLYLVEIDKNGFLAGDVFSGIQAPSGGGGFTLSSLAKASYPFTVGGNAGKGVYSAGGIFVSDGAGNITSSSVFDENNNGDVTLTPTVAGCGYTVDAPTGRVQLLISTGSGGCVTGGSGTSTYAVYQTSLASAVILEIDTAVIASGNAFQQTVVSTTLTGNFVFAVGAQGILHSAAGPNQQSALAQFVLNGTTVASGNLDFDGFNPPIKNDPIETTCTTTVTTNCTTIAAASAAGRGTMVLGLSNPQTTYNLVYYIVNANTALLFGQAANQTQVVQVGVLLRQF